MKKRASQGPYDGNRYTGQKIIELRIQGIVQGVGFRPHVFRTARHLGIKGTVANTGEGVVIVAQGPSDRLRSFVSALSKNAPPLAKIDSLEQKDLGNQPGFKSFSIIPSSAGKERSTLVSPDMATCNDCLRELFDPKDRRFNYPFINCTNCGPRYSIINSLPYDRPNTSMRAFRMCPVCKKEYNDPLDRRFHAQPNACWSCGPRLSWHSSEGTRLEVKDPVKEAARALAQGKIVAIKGLGGFHLACNALSDKAVSRLRMRKSRPHKPLAVMVRDLERAGLIAEISRQEERLLYSSERPIVLVKKKRGGPLSQFISPNIDSVGIMLPYTPLHHLLLNHSICPEALVMTSGNPCGQPICKDNQEAIDKLGDIADYFLLHDRDIVTRVDDSVIRFMADAPRMIRRSRGFVPSPIPLKTELKMALACGAFLKNTVCISRGNQAFLSQHIGDLEYYEAQGLFEEVIEHMKLLFEIQPELVVLDLHPDYPSTRYGQGLGIQTAMVQHHLAHAASVIAEHQIGEPLMGVIMDGTGLGTDGTIWGGEILYVDPRNFHWQRLAHLRPFPLPGGDKAAMEPWRVACSALLTTFGDDGLDKRILPGALSEISEETRNLLSQMIRSGINCPKSSSCGRLFDAASALLGTRLYSTYEGQGAMEIMTLALSVYSRDNIFKSLAEKCTSFNVTVSSPCLELDWTPIFKDILRQMKKGLPRSQIALNFHIGIIAIFASAVRHLSNKTGIKTIVLSGGCFQNLILLEGLIEILDGFGLKSFTNQRVPANDGGISLGQALVGGMKTCA